MFSFVRRLGFAAAFLALSSIAAHAQLSDPGTSSGGGALRAPTMSGVASRTLHVQPWRVQAVGGNTRVVSVWPATMALPYFIPARVWRTWSRAF